MISTTDIKRSNWDKVQEHLTESRLRVWNALASRGESTSRELADSMRVDILTVRPRLTELLQLGFVVLSGKQGHEGTYRALSRSEAHQNFLKRAAEPLNSQLEMTLPLS